MKPILLLALAGSALAWEPAPDSMLTEWGEKLAPDAVWKEYPRPAFERDQWTNLNGLWNYAISSKSIAEAPSDWQGEILVPFCVESALSGVKKRITPEDAIWYRRTFSSPASGENDRTLLHFEAVDHQSTVWINGTEVGSHTGGNLPFSFDITDALKDGDNTLTVKVTDATDTEWQLHGKQVSEPGGIWYTPVSGIWQTVWMETVPASSLESVKIVPAIDGTVTLDFETRGDAGTDIKVTALLDGKEVATTSGKPADTLTLKISDPKLWSPDSPTLYDLEITYGDDSVKSYVGLRETGVKADALGNLRFTLNGEFLFHWGTLDQGWWPDGLLTPPSDAAMKSDIEFLKAAGFNTIRKHIKIEPRRYYYHCDRLGMLMWQDQVSSGTGGNKFKNSSPKWPRLAPNPPEATWPDDAHEQWMKELKGMVDSLHNHPCIVQWVPFNERWGQHRTVKVGKWIVDYDPTRQINIASGGNFFPVGHIVDAHKYPHPGFPFQQGEGGRFDGFVKVMGEFGGHGFPVPDHLWDPKKRNWGYGGLPKNKQEWIRRYKTSLTKLAELKDQGIAGGIYTQTTDVEGEINGLITYDRKVQKLPPQRLKKLLDESGVMAPPAMPTGMNIPDIGKHPVRPAMSRDEIEAGLESHDRALYIKEGWIRDPYITRGPDDMYYLTGTTINDEDPREETDPYNVGLGAKSAVGNTIRVWKSKDLIDWESLGTPFTLKDSPQKNPGKHIWAPEVHWIPEMKRWAVVHCPKQKSNLALSAGPELKGPWTFPMGADFAGHHDPSLYHDGDHWWVLSENTVVQPLSDDFTKFTGPKTRIDPSSTRPNPKDPSKSLRVIGHEGATMLKVGDKYVHLGTAWSTDKGRQGSYNLYYCTSDKVDGEYGPRKFAGRFLGHGTPFQTRDGKWWCTAFFNANVPPLDTEGIRDRDLSATAQTINHRGTTIVPLEVKLLDDGEVYIRAKDPLYAHPGPDEAQDFDL